MKLRSIDTAVVINGIAVNLQYAAHHPLLVMVPYIILNHQKGSLLIVQDSSWFIHGIHTQQRDFFEAPSWTTIRSSFSNQNVFTNIRECKFPPMIIIWN